MLELARTSNHNRLFLLSKINYTKLYHQFKSELPEELALLFAKPQKGSSYTLWLSELAASSKFRSFSELDKGEQEFIATQMEEKKEAIFQLLSGHPTLGDLLPQLFQITDQDDIKVLESPTGLVAVLTSWGSKIAAQKIEANPLTTVLQKANNNRSVVHLQLQYTDGTPAADLDFILSYKGYPKTYSTDEYGQCTLGKFRHGSELSVAFQYGTEQRYQQQLVVDQREHYLISLPKVGDLLLQVLNQKQEPLEGVELNIQYKNERLQAQSNSEGWASIHYLEQGEQVQITVMSWGKFKK